MWKSSASILLTGIGLLVVICGPGCIRATNYRYGYQNYLPPSGFVSPGVFLNQPTIAVPVPSVRSVVVPNPHTRYVPTHSHLAIQRQPLTIPISSPGLTSSSRSDFSWQSVYPQSNHNLDKQLQAYVSSVEALTGTITELDEAVAHMKAFPKNCETAMSEQLTSPEPVGEVTSSDALVSSGNYGVSPATVSVSTTTESFTDPPTNVWSSRRRRDATQGAGVHFGLPTTANPIVTGSSSLPADQAGEDLAKASNDLKALSKDLSHAADFMKQTNHTVHSAMFRALQAYVTSIERRVDHQRRLYAQNRGALLKTKIVVIREKVANLMDRLKSLIPFKRNDNNLGREGTGSTAAPTVSTIATLMNTDV